MNSRNVLYWLVPLCTLAVLGGAVWVVTTTTGSTRINTTLPTDPPPFWFGDFSLSDQSNQPIDASILDGRLTLVDFFFTECPIYCPGMTAAMAYVAGATNDTDLRLLSISIDEDSPETMRTYAGSFGIDLDQWPFATGTREQVWAFVRTNLSFDISPTTPEQGSINHPTRLFLVGPDRAVLGMYRYDDPDEIDTLIAHIRRLSE